MRNFVLQSSLLFTSCIQLVHCQVTTTWPASKFIGYYIASDKTEPLLAGATWITMGNVAGDCTNNACALVTACSSGTQYYGDGSFQTCTSTETCATLSIYQRSPNVAPSAFNYRCRGPFPARTVYRELAATTTSSSFSTLSSSSRSSSSTPSMTSVASSDSTPSSTDKSGLTSSATTSSNTATSSKSQSSSKAWIAGAVIGPLVGLALIAGLVFWLMRRRSAQNEAGRRAEMEHPELGAGHNGTYVEKETYAYTGVPQEMGTPNQGVFPQEMGANYKPVELPGSHH